MIVDVDTARVVATLVPPTVAQGFSLEVARAGLEAEVASWSPTALAELEHELPAGWRARAPATVLVVAARTLPASAMRQCLLARWLGARVLLKCAAGQEELARALNLLDPEIVPTPFASVDAGATAAAIAQADTLVVLGSDATVASLRAMTPPDKGFAAHGHKLSAAWFGARASDAAVHGLAADLVAWDQAGCLAPQLVWVEGPPAALRALGERLGSALPALEASMPLADVGAHRRARQRAAPLAAMLGGELFGTPTALLATLPDPSFRLSPGPRIAWLVPAARAALDAVLPLLSTLALADASRADIAPPPSLRLCAPGEMQKPPLAWRQDGLHPLSSLLRP